MYDHAPLKTSFFVDDRVGSNARCRSLMVAVRLRLHAFALSVQADGHSVEEVAFVGESRRFGCALPLLFCISGGPQADGYSLMVAVGLH